MFIQNTWYVASFAKDVTTDNMVTRRLLDQPVLLWRTREGTVIAFEDLCPHRLVPLSIGRRLSDSIQCHYHGLEYDQKGSCIKIPGQTRIPSNAAVKTFVVKERHGFVWIWMGDAKLADAALIPEVPWMTAKGWAASPGYHHFQANYKLITDNLLDLSHESYVHEDTIGNEQTETIADFPVNVFVDGQVVVARREMLNIAAPPFFEMQLGGPGRIDRYQTAVWAPPATNMTLVMAHCVNKGLAEALESRILHLITPETERTSHYFWSMNRNFRIDDTELTEVIAKAVEHTFDQDRDMLQLQQKEIESTGRSVPAFATALDDAPLRARRILNALERQEGADRSAVMPVPKMDHDLISNLATP